MRVGERAENAHLAGDVRRIDALEAAAYHAGRRAVAERVRDPKLEPRLPALVQRVERAEMHRGEVDVVARGQLEIAEQVTPVGGEDRERGVPGGRERRPRLDRSGRRVGGRDELERAGDAFRFDTAHHPTHGFGSDTGSAAGDVEAKHRAGPPGPGRGEQCGGALAAGPIVHREHEVRIAPPRIQAAFDGVPLVDERHCANHKLRAVAKVEAKASLAKSDLRDVLREMLLIRRFEEKVEERFRAGELPGFLHVAIGQEACAVGVCRALEDGDVIASTHRAHGHTLAKGTHPNELMAELYGKQEGCSHGYGGSMHLYDVERGNIGANAVVGGGLPQITGAALAFQMRGESRVAVAFFGDGATNIGTFHEALNLAQLWKVPAVFVLEDNKWAESTPERQHSPIRDLSDRAKAFGMKAMKVDGQDVEAVYKTARQALEHARSGKGPVFVHLDCVRLHGHYIGDPQVYRDKDEARKLAETRDPITLLRTKLAVSDEDFDKMDAEVTEIVEASVEFSKSGTDPAPEDALKNVYA
jgi:acetoin:2,6-dichlorophenolindophenol oxidoreductase subunit alpha